MDNSLHEQGSRTQQEFKTIFREFANPWEPHEMAGQSYRVDGRRAGGGRHLYGSSGR